MDIQEKQLLEDTAKLAQENNKLLRKMHRGMVRGRIIRVLYWIVIVGIALGSFYFLQPYIEQMQGLLQGAQGVFGDLNGVQGLLGGFGG